MRVGACPSVGLLVFATTAIAYTRIDLQDPRGERGISAEAARLSAGGQQSSVVER